MSGEWWRAEATVVTHFRSYAPDGRLVERPTCGRALRWTGHDAEAKRTERCGYCTYWLARREA